MVTPLDFVIGAIYDLNDDRNSGWSAYFSADEEREELIKEVKRLKKLLSKRRSHGCKK